MKIWRAHTFGDPQDVLKLEEVPSPTLTGDRGFVLDVIAAGVGLPDLFMVQGVYPLVTQPPASPGQEVVGTIVEAGPECAFNVGDRVMTMTRFHEGFGGFAQTLVIDEPSATTVLAPDDLNDAEAAGFLIPFHTGHCALIQRGGLKAGENVLVLGGSGSSGSAAIQIAKAAGATVIATAGSDEKAQFCKDQGADHVVNYRDQSFAQQVRTLTEELGVDVIFDPVGGDSFTRSIDAFALDARALLVGFASGKWPKLDPQDMVMRSYSALGCFVAARTPAQVDAAKADLADWIAHDKIRPPIDKVFAFEDAPALMARLADGAMLGKMVLKVRG